MKYKAWSKEEDRALIEKVKAGFEVKDIAILHDRSEGAIYSRIKKFELVGILSDSKT